MPKGVNSFWPRQILWRKNQTQNSLAKGGGILKTNFDWPKQKDFDRGEKIFKT